MTDRFSSSVARASSSAFRRSTDVARSASRSALTLRRSSSVACDDRLRFEVVPARRQRALRLQGLVLNTFSCRSASSCL